MSAIFRRFLDARIPISPQLLLGMAVVVGVIAPLAAYLLVLVVGP